MEKTTFADLPIGALFFNYYGGDCRVKTSDTEAAAHTHCRNLFASPYRVGDQVKPYGPRADHSGMLDLTQHTVRPLASIDAGTLLGYVVVDDTAPVERETYEVAAWYRDHKLTPGTYPVYSGGLGRTGIPVYYVEVDSTITDACMVSLFGGVRYGADTAGAKEIGTASHRRISNGSHDYREDRVPFAGMKGFTYTPLENAQ